jgi:hypothetical protein
MLTIWKFALDITGMQIVNMPKNADILTAKDQAGVLTIWATVNPKSEMIGRVIEIIGTGNPMQEQVDGFTRSYISTEIMPPFVWHVFELIPL